MPVTAAVVNASAVDMLDLEDAQLAPSWVLQETHHNPAAFLQQLRLLVSLPVFSISTAGVCGLENLRFDDTRFNSVPSTSGLHTHDD